MKKLKQSKNSSNREKSSRDALQILSPTFSCQALSINSSFEIDEEDGLMIDSYLQ